MLTKRQSEILEDIDGYLLFVMSQAKVTHEDASYLLHLVDLLSETIQEDGNELAEDGKETPWD